MSNHENEYRDEHVVRCAKAQALRKCMPLWQEAIPATRTIAEALQSAPETYVEIHTYTGRMFAKREHGKSLFGEIRDPSGKIQLYATAQTLGIDAFKTIQELIDIGDYIWIKGTLFRTRTEELTIKCEEIKITSKCLHALPDKFHGLHDVETRYRQRYLDLMVNDEIKKTFLIRSQAVSTIRNFLESYAFLEVETPMLHPIPGGATARPFVTHHNALGTDLYLRIAPELYLKRLVVGGLERVYEINRNFRNEGVSTRHNPEFTMLEFYMAHAGYEEAMDLVEKIIRTVVEKTHGTLSVPYHGRTLDFALPFKRLNVEEALLQSGKISERELSESQIDATLARYHITVSEKTSHLVKLFKLFEEIAESMLFEPTFLVGFPTEISPLAKPLASDSLSAARFELYIAGMEISNGYNEMNDPFLQAERFKEQVAVREAGDEEAMYLDADFIRCLEYGLPPTAGVGIGIDRLVMLLTDSASIKDVILFPAMKRKEVGGELE